jgi:hypothetical protein
LNKQLLVKNQNVSVILDIIREQKPQTTKQLIKIAQERTGLSEREIATLILRLEKEDKLKFAAKEVIMQADSEFVLFSKNTAWFWVMGALAVAAAVVVFRVPEDLYPVAYLRQVLGLVFVLFLPGYAFVKLLFPFQVPFITSSESMDKIERIVLSLGLSLALTPIVGLILYSTTLGLGLVPITLSLLLLTVVLGSAALAREYQTSRRIGAHVPSR